jgi:hypothetical protein
MKQLIAVFILNFLCSNILAQNFCYDQLVKRGKEEFGKKNYSEALLKWETAKRDCPNLTANEIDNLNNLILSVKEKMQTFIKGKLREKQANKETKNQKIVYIDKPVERIKYIEKPVERIKYIEKPVERIKYIEKPVEKVIYIEKPEKYHPYGKGKAKLLINNSCSKAIKVWVDGEYWGFIDTYTTNGVVTCDTEGSSISKIVLSGKHHIVAEDNCCNGRWDFYITIAEDQCSPQSLACSNK